MLVKSSGFPLLKLRIAKNESLTGFMLNQILYGARGKTRTKFPENSPDILSLSWNHVINAREFVNRTDMNLPSLHECIVNHTLYPYLAWGLSEKDAKALYAQYAYEPATLKEMNIPDHSRMSLIGPMLSSRIGQTWCLQCARGHLTGNESRPFAPWHRLHFAPNILVCHIHGIPLSTYCPECQDKNRADPSNWIPALECICPKSLKDRAFISEGRMLHAICAITVKANEILQGESPAEFNPRSIKSAVRKRFMKGNRKGESRVTQILDAVTEVFGEGAAELLEFDEQTVNRFITSDSPPRVRNPMHILAFGYASFNGFDGLMETINGSTKWLAVPRPITRKSEQRRSRPRVLDINPKKAEFLERVSRMSPEERRALEQAGRDWLSAKVQMYPGLTRFDFWNRHRSRTNKFNYLVWIDTEWYKKVIPADRSIRAISTLEAMSREQLEITVPMIYERREKFLKENPFKKIHRTTLMHPLDSTAIDSLELLFPEIREALRSCVDQPSTWKLRAATTLSSMVSENHPNHHYADVNWYQAENFRHFETRFSSAKKWFFAQN